MGSKESRAMIPYAGSERIPYRPPGPSVDSLFRMGHDTAEIAERLDISEAAVLRKLNVLRSKRLERPSPYQKSE